MGGLSRRVDRGRGGGAGQKRAACQIDIVQGLLIPTLTSFADQCELQLRKIAYAVKNSTTILLPEWYRTLATHQLSHRIMPRDVSTCWNSTYDMVEFAVEYRTAIDTMTAARDLDLRRYELIPEEWKIAVELRDMLKVGVFSVVHSYSGLTEPSQIFKDATLYFSRGMPNLATVIPTMDHIDKVLATAADNSSKISPAIHAALAIGK